MNDKVLINENHPVWNVYDLLRTARLNVLYYEEKLYKAKMMGKGVQITLAVAALASAISGFELWDFWLGKYAWEGFVIVTSILAVIQPILGFLEKTNEYTELVNGYKTLYYDLENIREKIEYDKIYDKQHKKLFEAAKARRQGLEIKETGITPNKNSKLRKKCQEAVDKELPAKNFYLPSE